MPDKGRSLLKRVIFLFLDGVGLGADDPAVNPLAVDAYPMLAELLDGRKPVASSGRCSSALAELIPTDAQLGVPGRPQSATGQTALITGINASQRLGEHYGPRPDDRVRAVLDEGTIFRTLRTTGRDAFFCNAYPEGYFAAVKRGKRLLSAIPYAVTQAGQPLPGHDALLEGRALSADFTGEGWRRELGYQAAPFYTPEESGAQLWRLAQPYHMLFFEHWLTDVLGHGQALDAAVQNFVRIDGVLAGLLTAANLDETMIIVTSDHGNVEDCSHGKHTENPVLTLLLGAGRQQGAARVRSLTDFAALIEDFLGVGADRAAA